MNRSLWTPVILASSLCVIAMVVLAINNKRLSDQLAAERQAASQGPQGPPPERIQPTRSTTPSLPSKTKIERASKAVKLLTTEAVPAEGSKAKELSKGASLFAGGSEESAAQRIMFWENMPDLLRAVEDLSVDELLAVAADLPIVKTDDIGTGSDWIFDPRAHLIMLAAEQDPMRVFQDEELMEGMEKFAVLRCLAMVNPAEAMRLLPEVVTPKDGYSQDKRERIGALMLGTDVERGLTLLMETRQGDPDKRDGMQSLTGGLKLGFIPLREEMIPELEEAANNPKFAGIRNGIIKSTLDHSLSLDGVAGAARQANAMDLTPDEIGPYLDSVSGALIPTAPEAMVNWMSRDLTANQQSQKLPQAVVAWANRDIDAAAAWLGKQDPSPALDRTIAKFAAEASALDPEAAEAWARQIRNEQLQEETLRQVSDR